MAEINTGKSLKRDRENKDYKQNDAKVAVNTLQHTLFVERLCQRIDNTKDIYLYDLDNLYPQKVKSIAQRSPSTLTAIETASDFVNGDGFLNEAINNENFEINNEGETPLDLLRFIASEKKTFKGFAIHVNYNRFGQIAEISGIPFEFVRVSSDPGKPGFKVSKDWGSKHNYYLGKQQEEIHHYNAFNPEAALKEIQEEGFDTYKGQILYFKEDKKSIYPLCKFDAVMDYSQFEAEAALYQLSNVQNDFSLSGVLKLFKNTTFKEQNDDVAGKLGAKGTGGFNAGRLMTVEIPPMGGEIQNFNLFEPFSRNNIDKLFQNQNKNAETKIFAKYKQPKVLSSITDAGMFNDQQLEDAYNYYNTVTEIDRSEIRKVFNKVFNASIWQGFDFEIKPQEWISKESNQNNQQDGSN